MRKLSAVLFADIAGYTAMMQEDEKNALQLINKFKKDIEKQTGKFNGRIVQSVYNMFFQNHQKHPFV